MCLVDLLIACLPVQRNFEDFFRGCLRKSLQLDSYQATITIRFSNMSPRLGTNSAHKEGFVKYLLPIAAFFRGQMRVEQKVGSEAWLLPTEC